MKKALVRVHSEDADQIADAQANLSLRCAHSHFVGFVMRRLKFLFLYNSVMFLMSVGGCCLCENLSYMTFAEYNIVLYYACLQEFYSRDEVLC